MSNFPWGGTPNYEWASPLLDFNYKAGSIAEPTNWGPKVIINICNKNGNWEGSPQKALSQKWPITRKHFRKWFKKDKEASPFALGEVQFIDVTKRGWIFNRKKKANTWVANVIGMDGKPRGYKGYIKPGAIIRALNYVAVFAQDKKASVHIQKIGRPDIWELIEDGLRKELLDQKVAVYIYGS